MKFEIKNWLSGALIFTAEIECSEDAPLSIKLGLAVKKAVDAKVSLRYADLSNANLRYANLRYADLSSASSLWLAAGNNKKVKTIQAGTYIVNYTDTLMQIGCQKHTIEEWWSFDDRKIAEMDGKTALKFWAAWKPLLQQIIAASPAEPTGYVAPEKPAETTTAE